MTDDTDTRAQGVEFGGLAEDLEAHDYPTTASELVEKYGERELELPNGEQTFAEALGPLAEQEGEETYESVEEVKQIVLNMVEGDAVGREGYSDRGTSTEPNSNDEQSL